MEASPPLMRIPREIRDEIYKLILLNPVQTVADVGFERYYSNYLGIMYANKQFQDEVSYALKMIKPVVVISCNVKSLFRDIQSHAIPYVASCDPVLLRTCAARLHVKFPVASTRRILKVYVLLAKDVKYACLLLRSISLTLPHAPTLPIFTDGSEFRRIQLTLRLGAINSPIPARRQVELMGDMVTLNSIGKIKLVGHADDSLKLILPGHNEVLPLAPQGDVVTSVQRLDKFSRYRFKDACDVIKVSFWKNSIGSEALAAKHWKFAEECFLGVLKFIELATSQNPYILSAHEDIEIKIDETSFCAEMGLVKANIGAEDWLEAAFHVKPIIQDLKSRPCVTYNQARNVYKMESKIKKVLGDAFNLERPEASAPPNSVADDVGEGGEEAGNGFVQAEMASMSLEAGDNSHERD